MSEEDSENFGQNTVDFVRDVNSVFSGEVSEFYWHLIVQYSTIVQCVMD